MCLALVLILHLCFSFAAAMNYAVIITSIVGLLLYYSRSSDREFPKGVIYRLDKSVYYQDILQCTDSTSAWKCFDEYRLQLEHEAEVRNTNSPIEANQLSSCFKSVGKYQDDISTYLSVQQCYRESEGSPKGSRIPNICFVLIEVIVGLYLLLAVMNDTQVKVTQVKNVAQVKKLDTRIDSTEAKQSNNCLYTNSGEQPKVRNIRKNLQKLEVKKPFFDISHESGRSALRDYIKLKMNVGNLSNQLNSKFKTEEVPLSKFMAEELMVTNEPDIENRTPNDQAKLTKTDGKLENNPFEMGYNDLNKPYKRRFIPGRGWVSMKRLELEMSG